MRLLLTGANGFLGSHFQKEWKGKGHEVISLGSSKNNDIVCNLAKSLPKLTSGIDYVIHAAGKAHSIPKTEIQRKAFFDVNLKGTENLLQALGELKEKPKGLLFVSTVAVYGRNQGELIDESNELLALDPYGLSKIKAERAVIAWGKSQEVPTTIIRPPLVIGKDAPGNLKRMFEGIKHKKYANIAGGNARRSMVLADDIAVHSEKLIKSPGIYNVTDNYHPSFKELSHIIGKSLSKKVMNIPYFFAKCMAFTGDIASFLLRREMPFSSKKLNKMTATLTFNSSKASAVGWQPRSVLGHSEIWL